MNPWPIVGDILGWLVVVIVGLIAVIIVLAIAAGVIIVLVAIGQQIRDAIKAKLAGKPIAPVRLLPRRKDADDAQ